MFPPWHSRLFEHDLPAVHHVRTRRDADPIDLLRLRVNNKRPCNHRVAEKRDELPPSYSITVLIRTLWMLILRARPFQSPEPGFGEKYWSLSALPSHSFQSGGGVFLTVIFGQSFAYSAFSDSHFSSPGSVSGLIASTGHSGSQTPQSMHSSGWMTSREPATE